ncbi:MAG: hypothetical protein WBD51_21950, partial [Burkholderiaceae bacterium]
TFKEHGIYDLGDGHKLRAPRLWDIASNAGKRVWICGSMNAGVFGGGVSGAILPDPWATGLKPYPEKDFEDFFRYVQTSVQEYTRNDLPLTLKDHLKFGLFMLRNGLSTETIKRTIKQLISERGSGKFHWRRAMILDRLMWDLFRSRWKKEKPHYSTLFLNSTAHLQHYHWRNMDPSQFKIQPSDAEQAEFHDAILQGYQAMDRIVQDALQLVEGTNTSLVMMTALSQQPLNSYDETGGKLLYKAIDPNALQRFAGIENCGRYEPVMAEEFRLKFASDEAAAAAQEKLLALMLGDKPVIRSRRDGDELYLACAIITQPTGNATVVSPTGASAALTDLFYPLGTIKSGRHHPDGMFWVRSPNPKHRIVAEKVPLRRTTATLAALAGLDQETIKRQFVSPALDSATQAAQAAETSEQAEKTVI